MNWTLGLQITVAVTVIGYLIAFFRWIYKLSDSITGLGARFEERTGAMISDMRRMGKTLEELASVRTELTRLHEQSKDHEIRIRKLEYGPVQEAE